MGMSVTGICSVCGSGDANRVCDRCGNVVCEEHYDKRGVCTECAAEMAGDDAADNDDFPPSGGPQ